MSFIYCAERRGRRLTVKLRITFFSILSLLLVVSLFMQGTFAWYSDVKQVSTVLEAGNINYVYTGSLIGSSKIVPGQTLINDFMMTLTNRSSIDTNLRVKIFYSYMDIRTGVENPPEEYYKGCPLDSYMDFALSNDWVYDSDDNFFYYKGKDYTIPAGSSVSNDTFTLISAFKLLESVDNMLSGSTFSLKAVFQSKQKEIATWTDIGTADIIPL